MNINHNPLVSILIPVYNREELIGESLDSVLTQSYNNWECIIVDDGSTDNSLEIIKGYCERSPKFKFYKRPKDRIKGASSCRNYAFEKSKGELIQYLDSDDLLGAEKLLEQLKFYSNSSSSDNLALFTCKWGWFSDKSDLSKRFKKIYFSYNNFKKPINLLRTLGYYNEYLPLHNYLIPKDLVVKTGCWNENLSNNDDAEFITRVILNTQKIIFVENASVFYRLTNNNNLSTLNSEEKALSAIKSWQLINSYFNKNTSKTEVYVQNALFNLYLELLNTFPELVIKHKKLFDKRKDFNSTYYKFYKKARWIIDLN
tara:strand:- start:15580 stop:16521 length:942 start_codon:yes stop_codon:yes gene_type:complete